MTMTLSPQAATEERLRATWGVRPQPSVKILRWFPFKNPAGTMFGFISIELPSGLIINDCKLMVGQKGHRWIASPGQRQIDREGKPKRDANGKELWIHYVDFRGSDIRKKFETQVLETLRREHPEAFIGEATAR
jgi:hypothetical protein